MTLVPIPQGPPRDSRPSWAHPLEAFIIPQSCPGQVPGSGEEKESVGRGRWHKESREGQGTLVPLPEQTWTLKIVS